MSQVRNPWPCGLVLPFTLWFPLSRLLNLSGPLFFPLLQNGMTVLQSSISAQFLNQSSKRADLLLKTPASPPLPFQVLRSCWMGPRAIHPPTQAARRLLHDSAAQGHLLDVLSDTQSITPQCFLLPLEQTVPPFVRTAFRGPLLLQDNSI